MNHHQHTPSAPNNQNILDKPTLPNTTNTDQNPPLTNPQQPQAYHNANPLSSNYYYYNNYNPHLPSNTHTNGNLYTQQQNIYYNGAYYHPNIPLQQNNIHNANFVRPNNPQFYNYQQYQQSYLIRPSLPTYSPTVSYNGYAQELSKPQNVMNKSSLLHQNSNQALLKPDSQPNQNKETKNKHEQWPQSLKEYVIKVFDICKEKNNNNNKEALHKAVEAELKEIISKAHTENRLDSTKWEEMDLPMSLKKIIKEPKTKKKQTKIENNENLSKEAKKKQERLRRFMKEKPSNETQNDGNIKEENVQIKEVIDWDEYTIIGTSQNIEKPYLRLTSAPDKSTVRPLNILKKTLEYIQIKWQENRDYGYVCDQFKSMRQDLTVQRIKNEFTVEVYEKHARIAIEMGDMGEYNQCQNQLKQLYQLDIKGNESEFVAYRILYLIFTKNKSDMNKLLRETKPKIKRSYSVKHALQVNKAVELNNYINIFKLKQNSPNLGKFLIQKFELRERVCSMAIICKAFRPNISVQYVANVLGYSRTPDDCIAFLNEFNTQIIEQGVEVIDTKNSFLTFENALSDFRKVDIKGQIH